MFHNIFSMLISFLFYRFKFFKQNLFRVQIEKLFLRSLFVFAVNSNCSVFQAQKLFDVFCLMYLNSNCSVFQDRGLFDVSLLLYLNSNCSFLEQMSFRCLFLFAVPKFELFIFRTNVFSMFFCLLYLNSNCLSHPVFC